jgi:hypothetical protein
MPKAADVMVVGASRWVLCFAALLGHAEIHTVVIHLPLGSSELVVRWRS